MPRHLAGGPRTSPTPTLRIKIEAPRAQYMIAFFAGTVRQTQGRLSVMRRILCLQRLSLFRFCVSSKGISACLRVGCPHLAYAPLNGKDPDAVMGLLSTIVGRFSQNGHPWVRNTFKREVLV